MSLEMSPCPLASVLAPPSINSRFSINPGFSGVKIYGFCSGMVDRDSKYVKFSSQYTAREIIDKLSPSTLYRWDSFITLCWSLAHKTNKVNDLVCFNPNIQPAEIQGETKIRSSCSARFLAFCAFIIKAMLAAIDHYG